MILSTKEIRQFVDQYQFVHFIRVIDLTGFFGQGYCTFHSYPVEIVNKLQIDLHIGRNIDVIISSMKRLDKERIEFSVLFAPLSLDIKYQQYHILMWGKLILNTGDDGLKIEGIKIAPVE